MGFRPVNPLGGGGGGRSTFTPTQSPFADIAARDAWAAANLTNLSNSATRVTEVIVDGDLYRWSGEDQPASYDANQWLLVSNILDMGEVKTLYESNANTNAFTDSASIAVTSVQGLADGALPVATATGLANSMLTQMPDGTLRTEGSLRVGTNSIELDLAHTISSSGENVNFLNEQSNIQYHPLWQTYDVGRDASTSRFRFLETSLPIEVIQNTDLTNPIWSVTVPAVQGEEGQTILYADIYFAPTSVTTNISFELQIEGVTFSVFQIPSVTPDPVTGSYRFFYTPVFDFRTGSMLTFALTSSDGDVVLRGNSATSRPAVTVQLRLWNDEPVALLSDLAHPVTLRRDMPSEVDAQALVDSSLNDNSALWVVANNQLTTSNRSDAFINALQEGFLDVNGNPIPTTSVPANTIQLRGGSTVRVFAANDYRVVNSPVFESDISNGGGITLPIDADDVTVDSTDLLGFLLNSGDVQTALERIDSTGIGASTRTFDQSFTATYFADENGYSANTATWYGGSQSVSLRGTSPTNRANVFTMPDSGDVTAMFDDMAARGLAETYTVTIQYSGGNSGFVNRNSLTIRNASISNGFPQGTFPTVLARGHSTTFRITRAGGVTSQWERLDFSQSVDPVPTLGEVVLQSRGWNNADGSLLPSGTDVLLGYAFPVIGSSPNDGTLRQGLLDAGVSDRIIYDGDYAVWTGATFTSWADGDDWFVLPRNQLEILSREESNFLAQTSEIDNRVDIGLASSMTSDALVWLSENPLASAPSLTPSTDPINPRAGDDYEYIGGRENRNAQLQFQFGQNRFNNFLTIGITPNFITGHPESTIDILLVNDGEIIERLNLANDFTFRNDGDFTNGTVRHYTRNTSFNYPFLATVNIVLTQVQRHFTISPDTVNLTQNVSDLAESQLDSNVQEKLNRALPAPDMDFSSIENRLLTEGILPIMEPDIHARFLSASATDAYPSQLSQFGQVSSDNPRFLASDVVMFIATPEPGNFALRNTTADTIVSLDQSEPTVSIEGSISDSGVTYFVFRVTSIVSGNRYEVLRVTQESIIIERNDISNLKDDVARIDAELEHAALNLPDAVIDILDNDVTVSEESNPVVSATQFNEQLAGDSNNTQTVFFEPSPNTPSGGALNSNQIKDTSGSRARRKLIYLDAQTFTNQTYVTAFDGASTRDLIRYADGQFTARQFVPAIPASTVTDVIYPAPSNRVSGSGIWINVPALTFVNGTPQPLADEVFFTRNIPATSVVIKIDYRGHANGNIFGTSTTSLPANQDSISFVLNDGSESATVQVLRRDGELRVSVTERVNAGLPTINDIEVILSYEEVRTVPATNSRTRDVPFESVTPRGQVFAIKPSATGDLILVGSNIEVNTGFAYTELFGASESGHLTVMSEESEFFDYQDFEPIPSTIIDLENHASLTQRGLFTTDYTRETVLNLGVTFRPVGLNVKDLPTSATGLASGDVWFDGSSLKFVP